MSLLRTALAAAVLLPVSTVAIAGDNPSQPDNTKVGVGISMDVISQLGMLGYFGYVDEVRRYKSLMVTNDIRVPVILSSGLRIEPELGFRRYTEGGDNYSSMTAGVAVAPSWAIAGKGSAYAGGRAGVVRTTYPGDSEMDLSLGGLAGGEYFVGRSFSVGGEVNLDWMMFDEQSWIDSSINTTASLIARFYFN